MTTLSGGAGTLSPSVARSLWEILAARDKDDVFPELAFTLYAFIAALDLKTKDTAGHVCFLSREGQPLMYLYDTFRARRESGPRAVYLEVSRRATLLPSLGPLDREQFKTLFRQYRAISIYEFLASLGLEGYLEELSGGLDAAVQDLHARSADLPTDPMFQKLLRHPKFISLYEQQRGDRRTAFLSYLTATHAGTLPQTLHLVDVGWKGTIQDNLHSLLSDSVTPIRCISGHYVGLVAPGDASATNRKHGLLFSCVDGVTPFFRTFNENRALFEILLAADHGSVESYRHDVMRNGHPVRAPFEEESMIRAVVSPVQTRLFERFRLLCELLGKDRPDLQTLLAAAAKRHARMVFRPSTHELDWFSSVFHVENYGVFERSEFRQPVRRLSLLERMAFVLRLRNRATWPDLGFWPYKTIRDQGGTAAAWVYGWVRRGQN